MTQQTLLLIDGFNLLSRSHFATAYGRSDESLKNSKGIYTNAVRVFAQKLFNMVRDHAVTHLVVAWDVKRDETTRRIKHEFYKATRSELPEPLIRQYEVCKRILDCAGIPQISIAPYEADDIIGTLSKKWMHGNCLIYSNDRDLFQLLSDSTSQIISRTKGDVIYSAQDFYNDYGIVSGQWVDVKALLGDTSDNIPGCPGIGEKSALPLIRQYGTLEQIYEQIENLDQKFNRYKKKLTDGKDTVLISRELSEIICDIAELEELLFDDLQLNIAVDPLMAELAELEVKIKLDFLGAVV